MVVLRSDLGLVVAFLRSGGGPRALLITLSTALVSGLLLVAVSLALFTVTSARDRWQVSELVADGDLRAGYLLSVLLICIAPLALLRQVLRLGTASREQRLAGLRLAGATPGDVRRLSALEVGLPSLAGGLLGYPVFAGLGLFLGAPAGGGPGSELGRQLRLIPTDVDLAWWQVLVVAASVALLGAIAGAGATRALVVSPLGVSRRAPATPPRPWALLPVIAALPLFVLSAGSSAGAGDIVTFGALVLLVLGLLGLAPWVAYGVGRAVASRASTVPVLLAGRRLRSDARAAGRAAAAVGAIALVAGGGGVVLTDLPDTGRGEGFGEVDAFYTVPMALAGMALLGALLLVVFSMAVHGVESALDHKRSVASLAALGASSRDVERAQQWEIGLVAIPMAIIGVLLGSIPVAPVLDGSGRYAWIPVLVDVTMVALVWLAVRVSTLITRPWLHRAMAPANLRTP